MAGGFSIILVILTYFQNSEINKPLIFPQNVNAIIENVTESDKDNESDQEWISGKFQRFEVDKEISLELELSLFNLGRSTATEIEIEWKLDLPELENNVRDNFREGFIPNEITEDNFTDRILFLKNDDTKKVKIPKFLTCGFEWENIPNVNDFNFGPKVKIKHQDVKLQIKYSDSLKNPYRECFLVNFDLLGTKKIENQDRNGVLGFLESYRFKIIFERQEDQHFEKCKTHVDTKI